MIFVAHRINTVNELKMVPFKFGIEVDVTNYADKLVLAHDPFIEGENFESFIKNFKHRFIIINIKTEGIEYKILEILKKFKIKKYFFLDCSFPMIFKLGSYKKTKVNLAVRYSKYESIETVLKVHNFCKWVWIDCLDKKIEFKKNKNLYLDKYHSCIVSPELHNRVDEIENYAIKLKSLNFVPKMICSKIDNYKIWKKYFPI